MMASSGTDLVKIPTIDKAYLRAKYEGMSTPKIALYGTAPPFFGGLDISIDIAYSTVFYIYQPNIYIYIWGFPMIGRNYIAYSTRPMVSLQNYTVYP